MSGAFFGDKVARISDAFVLSSLRLFGFITLMLTASTCISMGMNILTADPSVAIILTAQMYQETYLRLAEARQGGKFGSRLNAVT